MPGHFSPLRLVLGTQARPNVTRPRTARACVGEQLIRVQFAICGARSKELRVAHQMNAARERQLAED